MISSELEWTVGKCAFSRAVPDKANDLETKTLNMV